MASGDVLPRFFSVFLSQYSSHTFVIPSSYYEHLPRRLPKTAILSGTGGKTWKVAMKSKQDQVYFEQGWGNFVTDNNLKDGEFLTFIFDGYNRFEVSIYGLGGCKEIRAVVQVEEISDGTESDNGDDDESLDSIIDEEVINAEESSEIQDITVNSVHPTEVVTTSVIRRNRAIENPEAYLDDPNNVCFETHLKRRKFELMICGTVVKDYDLKFRDTVEYIDGFRTLTGKVKHRTDHRICINGWHSVCRRNNITANDSILCELIRDGEKVVYAVKVHIISNGATRS